MRTMWVILCVLLIPLLPNKGRDYVVNHTWKDHGTGLPMSCSNVVFCIQNFIRNIVWLSKNAKTEHYIPASALGALHKRGEISHVY